MTGKCLPCGSELAAEARFCRRCGARTGDARTAGVAQYDANQTQQIEALPLAASGAAADHESAFAPTEALATPGISLSALLAPTVALAPDWETPPASPASPAWPAADAGSALISERQPLSAAVPHPRASHRKWLALGAPALLLVIASGLFFLFNSRQSSAGPTVARQANEQAPAARPLTNNANPVLPSAPPVAVSVEKSPAKRSAPAPAPSVVAATAKPVSVQPALEGAAKPAASSPPVAVAKPVVATATAADHIKQGTSLLSAGNYGEALGAFERARRMAPDNRDVYYLIGQAHHQMGQLEPALAAYRQCSAGVYAAIAQNHVTRLEKKLRKSP